MYYNMLTKMDRNLSFSGNKNMNDDMYVVFRKMCALSLQRFN